MTPFPATIFLSYMSITVRKYAGKTYSRKDTLILAHGCSTTVIIVGKKSSSSLRLLVMLHTVMKQGTIGVINALAQFISSFYAVQDPIQEMVSPTMGKPPHLILPNPQIIIWEFCIMYSITLTFHFSQAHPPTLVPQPHKKIKKQVQFVLPLFPFEHCETPNGLLLKDN